MNIGKLTYIYHSEDNNVDDVKAFVFNKLSDANTTEPNQPKDVVLNGFGRIGRFLARKLMAKTGKGNQLRLRAIVTRDSSTAGILEKRAYLLRADSVHGKFMGTVHTDFENNALVINGTTVYMIYANRLETIDYKHYGIQ